MGETSITVYKEKEKSVELRRKIIKLPYIKNVLNKVEFQLFEASIQKSIIEYDSNELIEKITILTQFISKDVGIQRKIEPYENARFIDIIRKYYNGLSLSEIKIAFELAMVGELDEYFPERNGLVDNSHYQNFSVEYISKILNAYIKKKNKIINKALVSLPTSINKLSKNSKQKLKQSTLNDLVHCFLRYKYTGKFITSGLDEFLYFKELEKTIIAPVVEILESDNIKAQHNIINSYSIKRLSNLSITKIIKEGKRSEDVKSVAYFIARKRAIIKCFDYLINKEYNINEFINT